MSRRIVGVVSLFAIAMTAVGLMAFTFLGTATGVAGGGSASAYGVRASVSLPLLSTNLVGPAPQVVADAASPLPADAHLVKLALPPIIQEIGALVTSARVDLAGETVTASSDTAHVGLVQMTGLPAGLPALPAVPTSSGVPIVGGLDLSGLGIQTGNLLTIAPGTTKNAVDLDALHGVVRLNCNQLKGLKTASTTQRLSAITNGSNVAKLELLGTAVKVLDDPSVSLTPDAGFDERRAAARIELLPSALGLSIPTGLADLIGLIEVTVYDVQAKSLTTDTLTNATVSAQVDMLRVRVFDKLKLGIAADIRIGHAQASLSNCAAAPKPTPPPTGPTLPPVIEVPNVSVNKVVESINGTGVISQQNLTVARGQDIEYSLTTVNNSLPATCSITRIVDALPANTTLVSEAGELGAGIYDSVANTVTWDGLAIPGGVGRRQGLVLRMDGNAPSGTYFNRYTASGTCGSFTAVAPGVTIAPRTLRVLGSKFVQTPQTGLADSGMWLVGLLAAAGAIGGATVLRRT